MYRSFLSVLAKAKTFTDIDLQTVFTGVRNNSTDEDLMFQRGIDIDDDDDWGAYLELNDRGNSAYEIIKFCHLTPDNQLPTFLYCFTVAII